MNILLIYPAFPNTFWSFKYALSFINKKAAHPPLGLITIAALLPDHWNRKLVDVNTEKLTAKKIEWADLVFISGMTVQRKSATEIIQRCHDMGKKVVVGGPLFVAEKDDFSEVDHLVLDEAELTLPEFIRDFENGDAKKEYRAPDFCDIKTTPVPEWHLLKQRRYASMSIQFSRGCPYDCDFCNVTALFGHRPRLKAAEQIVRELDALNDSGWSGPVFFVDDNFIGNRPYLKNHLLPALIEWQKNHENVVFYTEASINLADDPELMDMMVKAGFDSVFIGIESPDECSLTECHKSQNTNRDMLESVKTIQRHGLQVSGGFIVGFDSDNLFTFQKQIDFIQKSGIVTAMVGMLQAMPGTRLFDRMKSENRLKGLVSGDNVDGTTNIIPKMGLENLVLGYRNLMKRLYSPRCYYHRVRLFLKEFKAPEITLNVDFNRFLAFFRSCVRLGVLGKERFQFWRLMLWTIIRRPRLLPLAVTLAIYGYHFRRVARNI